MSQQAIATPKAVVKTPPYAWLILIALYLATLAAPLNQFKKFEFRLSAAFDVPVFPP